MSNELKPCPFCGGEAAFGANSCQGFEYVRCASCKARTWSCYDTKDQAAEAWNTRAERTCKPNVYMDDQITESIQRWLGECDCGAILGEGTDEYRVSLCFPNYCPCCGAKVVE